MKRVVRTFCVAGVMAVLAGCAGLNKQIPAAGMTVDIGSMDRDDYVVLDRVNGESSRTSICGGVVQIVDGEKMIICGLRLFADHYSLAPQEKTWIETMIAKTLNLPSTSERAYYNALAATPDADVIIPKTFDYEDSGFPIIFMHEKVSFKGKAIKLKTDKQLQ